MFHEVGEGACVLGECIFLYIELYIERAPLKSMGMLLYDGALQLKRGRCVYAREGR